MPYLAQYFKEAPSDYYCFRLLLISLDNNTLKIWNRKKNSVYKAFPGWTLHEPFLCKAADVEIFLWCQGNKNQLHNDHFCDVFPSCKSINRYLSPNNQRMLLLQAIRAVLRWAKRQKGRRRLRLYLPREIGAILLCGRWRYHTPFSLSIKPPTTCHTVNLAYLWWRNKVTNSRILKKEIFLICRINWW